MKQLLFITSLVELGAGLALLVAPSALVWLLVGSTVDAPAAQTVARVGGAALVALSIACGIASIDATSRTTRGLVAAMLFYNVAVFAILPYAYVSFGMRGVALWPAVILHVLLAVWCAMQLVHKPTHFKEK